jgi:hypothetical protein
MSFSMFFYAASVIAAYKLGAYGATNPDGIAQWTKTIWAWMNSKAAR